MVQRDGRTSFTAVMSNNRTKERTFFQHAGANAYYGEEHIDWDKLDVNIFHIGYILLLPHLDEPDAQYGTKMARLLDRAQKAGMKTSIDVVSESGERFQKLVTPALRYTDYCIINELETQQTTGVCLRDEDGTLHVENMKAALQKLHELGVSTWAVIHCPELGCGMDADGSYYEFKSLRLPEGYIKGSVGAGDAFCAGVLYAAETGMTLPEALKLGACTAAASSPPSAHISTSVPHFSPSDSRASMLAALTSLAAVRKVILTGARPLTSFASSPAGRACMPLGAVIVTFCDVI